MHFISMLKIQLLRGGGELKKMTPMHFISTLKIQLGGFWRRGRLTGSTVVIDNAVIQCRKDTSEEKQRVE